MKSNDLVSVIIPIFNVQPYLEEALNSVIHQTYDNLEIIIIDDGSTDESGRICDEFGKKDKRIQVIHQNNKGLSNARNVGLDVSTGEAIAFLDSDDAYHLNYIATMVFAMINQNADIAVCKYGIHNTMGIMSLDNQQCIKPFFEQDTYNRASMLRALADDTIDHHVWNKVYTRHAWGDYRFPDGRVFEDSDALFHIVNCKDITCCTVDKPLYKYRNRPGSITDTPSQKNVKDWLYACSRIESFIGKNIPTLFSYEHLMNRQQLRITGMTVYYARLSERKGNESFCEDLRKQILQEVKEYGVKGIRARIAYLMICMCPKLIGTAYKGYAFTKRIVIRN